MSENTGRTQTAGRGKLNETHLVLTFVLGSEQYAVPLLTVREIIGYVPAVPVPQSPAYLRGIINLRGRIIPVIDLRRKFQMPDGTLTQQTCIIVVEFTRGETAQAAGLLVDAVLEVLEVRPEQIEPPADMLQGSSFLDGLIKSDSAAKLLLNIDRTLSEDRLSASIVQSAEQAA